MMFSLAFSMQKEKRYLVQGGIFFAVFLFIYFLLDYLNIGYAAMTETYGLALVVFNVFLNVVMAAMSAMMMNLSTIFFKLNNKEGKGTFMSVFAMLFGMMTYGCTPCVITFFATIGITFSVAVLPLAGLPYKLVALLLIVIGFLWLRHEMNHARCEFKPDENQTES